MDHYKKYIAGGLSGIVEVAFTYPLDYLKVKKQEHVQNNIKTNFFTTLKNEKNLNLYRGVGSRLLGVAPIRFTFWGVQNSSSSFLTNNQTYKSITKNYSIQNEKLVRGTISGILGGFCQTLIDNPVENYKIQKIVNCAKPNLKDIIINNYGFVPNLYRNIGFASAISVIAIQNNTNDDFTNFALASTSAVIGTLITQPFDYVKTLQQRLQQNTNTSATIQKALKTQPSSLYSGCFNRSSLNFLSMGIGYVAYDNIYKLLFVT